MLGQDSDIARGKSLGVIDYIVKARLSVDELVNKVKDKVKLSIDGIANNNSSVSVAASAPTIQSSQSSTPSSSPATPTANTQVNNSTQNTTQ